METVSRFGQNYLTQVFARYKVPTTNITRAAASNAPTLISVSNIYSRDAALMWLRFHIAETFAFLGIYDTASKLQVVQTAELILDHELFAQMNLSEFLMFLKYFKRGDFGKIYQSARPNPQEFLSCLRPFWNDLVEYRIKLSKAEQEKRQAEMEKRGRENAMTHEEWIEIKTITAMYNSDYTVP